ncbi:hypothetical protein RSJ21_12030 [Clostridium botulinum]|uniref:Uncharacterized protein n=2 Tax=Clostridium botulinum TaxID=1491 RepID=A5I418_CLOBH|nr:hypothetical protein [Clostridium botulinum]EPS47613.1 hypothetical protein CFSAN002369_21043 [Clostridium botulinum CFSAN002369]EPS51250.1 hypothetical protein CFSAN002367_07725 [Clostridium botulinum CFSAN002367]ABS34709.1 hypothetical protein CLB_2189 [Clostridium botulinum A str. ATCC 19397]ABS39218.1 hypothetical protein CLC_2172 [Clostridium botulinum A str. Hall]AUM88236.1 hypothetical protein RSJ15_11200 [Clostridium botulinum]
MNNFLKKLTFKVEKRTLLLIAGLSFLISSLKFENTILKYKN